MAKYLNAQSLNNPTSLKTMDTESLIVGAGESYKGSREMAKLKSQQPKYKPMDKVLSKEEILESKNLHNYYFPNGDSSKPMIHDRDCHFCDYENQVEEAMDEFAKQCLLNFPKWCDTCTWHWEMGNPDYKDWDKKTHEQVIELYLQSIK